MADSSSPDLEALTGHLSALDVPFGAERTRRIVSTLSKTAVKAILDGTNWAQKGGTSKPSDFARRQIIMQASNHAKRCSYLAKIWITDHADLLTYMQANVEPDSLREDLATLFQEHEAKPEEISLALRFDARESIRAASEELSSELLNEMSPLRAQYTIQQLREENETLRSEKSDHAEEVEELQAKISDLESTRKKLRGTREELKHKAEHLEQKLADRNDEIQTVRDKLQTARSTVKTRTEERDSAQQEVESLKNDLRLTKQTLESAREETNTARDAVGRVLDLDASPEPDQIASAIQSALDEVRRENDSLREDVERLRAERNQLAPALDQIDEAWEDALDALSNRVAHELETAQHDASVEPSYDWKEWMTQEQSLITSLLSSMEDASEDNLSDARELQDLLQLRWYLLEWIKIGLRRQLNASSVATQPFDAIS